jgi:hypothetical protein
VREPDTSRVALILPVHTTQAARAATQIVVFLLRTTPRAELALLSRGAFVRSPRGASERFGLLFAAVQVRRPRAQTTARGWLERLIRAQVERAYAREGLTDVQYDLAIL